MAFTNILFPVDFSERSLAIVPFVQSACDGFMASLTLLHVVHLPILAYGAIDAPVEFDWPIDQLKENARERLAEFGAASFPGKHVETIVDEGESGWCIVERARTLKTDLIMMPTRGQGRFRAALLGSVTAKTLHDADCAVWTEAHRETADGEHTAWRSIVCAIDTVAEGAGLISVAAELAESSKAKVQLVHAVPEQSGGYARYLETEFTESLKEQARQTIAEMQKEAGTNFEVCTETGAIPDVARAAALSQNADLVLIGRGVLPQFGGRLRSHVYSIVRDMPCPVLSVSPAHTG